MFPMFVYPLFLSHTPRLLVTPSIPLLFNLLCLFPISSTSPSERLQRERTPGLLGHHYRQRYHRIITPRSDTSTTLRTSRDLLHHPVPHRCTTTLEDPLATFFVSCVEKLRVGEGSGRRNKARSTLGKSQERPTPFSVKATMSMQNKAGLK
ncbi:hypothetical protein B0O80DRAFT_128227 [Mortierella sp. GBAus27b]|nr:hypothetical protein B0O80DRAFT_128227 [Mortierella sp. GBAus27b]